MHLPKKPPALTARIRRIGEAYVGNLEFTAAAFLTAAFFAAWEQPELFSEEVRAAFRSLR